MSLEVAVAVPFRQQGTDRLGEGAFVVALSLDREWFSPDQAKRLVDVAVGRGLLEKADGDLVASFDTDAVDVPPDYTPDTDILREQSTFEQLLDRMTDAGMAKQEAVAAANETQRALGITLEAAAVLVATREGIAVDTAADAVRADLSDPSE